MSGAGRWVSAMTDLGRKIQAVLLAILLAAVVWLFWAWYLDPHRFDPEPPRIDPFGR